MTNDLNSVNDCSSEADPFPLSYLKKQLCTIIQGGCVLSILRHVFTVVDILDSTSSHVQSTTTCQGNPSLVTTLSESPSSFS